MSDASNKERYDNFIDRAILPNCFIEEFFPARMIKEQANFWLPGINGVSALNQKGNEDYDILISGGFRAEAMAIHLCSELWKGLGGRGKHPKITMFDAWGLLFLCEVMSETRISNVASWTVENGRLKPSLRLRPWKDPGIIDDFSGLPDEEAEELAKKRFLLGLDGIHAVHLLAKCFKDLSNGEMPFLKYEDIIKGKTMRDFLLLFKNNHDDARKMLPAWYLHTVFSGVERDLRKSFEGNVPPEEHFQRIILFSSRMAEELLLSSRNHMNDPSFRSAFLGGSPDERLLLRSSDPGFHCDLLTAPILQHKRCEERKAMYSPKNMGINDEKIGWRTSRLILDLVMRLDAVASRRGLPRQYVAPSALSMLRYDRIIALSPMIPTEKNRHDPRIPHTDYFGEMKKSLLIDLQTAKKTGIPFEWMRGLKIDPESGEKGIDQVLRSLWKSSPGQLFPLIIDAKYDISEGKNGMFAPFIGNFVKRTMDGSPDERDVLCATNALEKISPERDRRETKIIEIPLNDEGISMRIPTSNASEFTR